MSPADLRAEVERLEELRARLVDRLDDDTLTPNARWLAQRDLEATQERLARARDQIANASRGPSSPGRRVRGGQRLASG